MLRGSFLLIMQNKSNFNHCIYWILIIHERNTNYKLPIFNIEYNQQHTRFSIFNLLYTQIAETQMKTESVIHNKTSKPQQKN
jgi:hypothetical protein